MSPEEFSTLTAEQAVANLEKILRAQRESEERYRSLVVATSQVVWVTDAEGRVQDMPQWRELTGQSEQEVRGWGWLDALHPDDREGTRKVWAEAISSQRQYETEYRIRVSEGGYRYFAARGVPVVDDGGRIREWVGVCTDITERKLAEEALRESNQTLQAVIRAAPLGIVTLDNEGIVKTWNPAAENIYGWSADEVIGRLLPTVPEDKIEEFITNHRRAVRGEVFSGYETRRMRKDGTPVEISISTAPLIGAGGQLNGVVALVTDITARKLTEAAIRASDERALADYGRLVERIATLAQVLGAARDLATIFAALRDFARASVPCIGIFISLYDAERDVRTAVYAWGDGEEVDVSVLPPMPVTAEGPNSRTVRTGVAVFTDDYQALPQSVPVISIGPPDGPLPNSSLVVPMAVMGHIIGTIEVQSYELAAYQQQHATALQMAANLAAVAIENVRLFERETGARAVAEESNRVKDEFLATLSHELRTPLTAVLGWTKLMRTEKLDAAETIHALEVVERNARLQARLVDELLEVSRVVTGKFRLDVRPVRLDVVVAAAVDVVRPAAASKDLEINAALEYPDSIVTGDPDRLQQVVWNILSNAVKFTPPGGRVDVRIERDAASVSVSVSDTGQGISPDFLPYIFDRFRQADSSTTRRHGGLGLGLAIVRHLVELHGGKVRAESAGVNMGAKFVIDLPLASAAAGVAGRREAALRGGRAVAVLTELPSESSSVSPRMSLAGVKVLVAEDEPDTCEYLARVLTQHGAEVTAVTSTDAALAALADAWPDVLVSDIGMPGADGYELIRRVRLLEMGRGRRLPAAALTAYAGADERAKSLQAGFQVHVAKPIGPATLISLVADLAALSGEKD
ncbi:MAG: PAS domain S-box protein [Pyrinomonadaceae bacterium]|nr:PAS domain S-box protein [Pyrinomonadaceae bacterium]